LVTTIRGHGKEEAISQLDLQYAAKMMQQSRNQKRVIDKPSDPFALNHIQSRMKKEADDFLRSMNYHFPQNQNHFG